MKMNFTNTWNQDQGLAMNSILRVLSEERNVTYSDMCLEMTIVQRDLGKYGNGVGRRCYDLWMTRHLNLPAASRALGGICLPNCNASFPVGFMTRFGGCHVGGRRLWYGPNDFLYHPVNIVRQIDPVQTLLLARFNDSVAKCL